jgi:diketogulonate reductase-like aldo/keto reductase
VLSRGESIVPIPGTRSLAHLEEDIAAARLDLPPGVADRITALFAGAAVRGARYSAAMQAQIATELLPDEELAD